MLFHKNAKRFNQIDWLLCGIKRIVFTLSGLDVLRPCDMRVAGKTTQTGLHAAA